MPDQEVNCRYIVSKFIFLSTPFEGVWIKIANRVNNRQACIEGVKAFAFRDVKLYAAILSSKLMKGRLKVDLGER